tara:strand:- start:67 stop:1170 length:1104 start_codon:yes stop_codon:yes gene_type:complete
MQTKGPIGMKLTNRFFYSFLPIILFGNFVLADDLLGPNIKSLVENAFDQELKQFKECISVEGLIGKDQINTECPLEDLTRLYETLNQIQDPDLTLFLEGFTAPEKLKTPTLYYPKKAQQRGITGFAIVSFDLDEDGLTNNHKIIPPLSHSLFRNEALKAAKKLRYKPLTFEGKPVAYSNMVHKFTFMLESKNIQLDKARKSFNQISRLLKEKKYSEAEKLALKKLDKDPFFYYQLSLAQYMQKKYEEAAGSALDFLNQEDTKELITPEYYFYSQVVLIYAESLFKASKFDELLEVENMLYEIQSEDSTKNNVLMTKLYLGTALIYQDQILDGIYYLTNVKNQAAKDKNENLLGIINSILGNLENALS